jgi:hypothetical protein
MGAPPSGGFSSYTSVGTVNPDGTGDATLIASAGFVRDVEVDLAGGKIYWADATNPSGTFQVYRANLDGTGQEVIATVDSGVSGIGLDADAGHIYIGSIYRLYRANLDGSSLTQLLSGYIFSDVEVVGGSLYWSSISTIQRADLDGANVQILVSGQQSIVGLDAVDSLGQMFWADQSSGLVQSAALDGTGVTTIATGSGGVRGVAVDPVNGRVYWGQGGNVSNTALDGSDLQNFTVDASILGLHFAGGSASVIGDTASVSLTVNNVAPAVAPLVLSASSIDEGGSVTVDGTFTDPGTLDTHEVVIDWGDGSAHTVINLTGGERTFSAPHQYGDDNQAGAASGQYTITATVTDDDTGSHSASATIAVTSEPANFAPVIGAFPTSVVNYTENAAPVVIGGGTVTDPDRLDFSGGTLTVSLSEGGTSDDRLGVKHIGFNAKQIGVDGGQITYGIDGTQENALLVATFTGGVGTDPLVITFNQNALAVHVTAVLRAVTFHNISDDPVTAPRQASFVVTDGDGGTSDIVTRAVNVIAKNDAPMVTTSASVVNYTEGEEPVVIDGGATVFDLDSLDFDTGKLTVKIASGAQSTDRLGIHSSGPISVNVATLEVSYDGNVIGTFAGTTTLTVRLNAQATQEATQELLRHVTFSSISKAPSIAPRSITFTLTDGDGGTSAAAAAATVTITPVNDDPVIGAFPTTVAKYTENAAPVVIGGGTVTDPDLMDFGGGTLTVSLTEGATPDDRLGVKHTGFSAKQIGVDGGQITYGTDGTQENALLVATYITGGVGTDPLVITFNQNALAVHVTAVLKAVTFHNISDDPVTAPRQASFVVTDGDGGTSDIVTRAVNVIAKNDAPVVTTSASVVNYTEGGEPVVIDGGATVFDIDSLDFDTGKLTVKIASGAQSTDRLGIHSSGPISVNLATLEVSYDGNVIGTFAGTTTLTVTLNAQATPEATQELLRHVTFSSISKAPSTAPRSITFTLTDGDGGTSAAAAAATVTITPVNDAPVIGAFPTTVVNYTENAAPVVIGGGTVTDPDLVDFGGGTLTVSLTEGARRRMTGWASSTSASVPSRSAWTAARSRTGSTGRRRTHSSWPRLLPAASGPIRW